MLLRRQNLVNPNSNQSFLFDKGSMIYPVVRDVFLTSIQIPIPGR